jgi:hypothetical protein
MCEFKRALKAINWSNETAQRYPVKVYGVSGKVFTTKDYAYESALRIAAKVSESVLVWKAEVLDETGKAVFFVRQTK